MASTTSDYHDTDRLLALIQRLYAAPGTVDGWQDFLLDLSTHLNATGAVILSHDLRSRHGSVQAYAGFDPDAERGYLAHWGAHDPWAYNPVIATLVSGDVVMGEQLVPHDQMRRTPYYNEFGRQHGIAHCLAGLVEVERHAFSCVTLNGTEKRGPFGRPERALLDILMPHLQRALQIHRRLSDADERADNAGAALDYLPHGVLLLDRSGRVVFTNRTADEMIRANDGLSVRHRELFGARTQDTNTLRALVAQAASTSAGHGAASGGLVLIGRPSGRAALRVLVTPVLRRHAVVGHESAAACVFVTDPECLQTPSSEHVQRTFALTPAETRVAMAMLDGESIAGLSDRLCISQNTARTHLRRLFAKTATARQADLIRVLLGAHAPVRFD